MPRVRAWRARRRRNRLGRRRRGAADRGAIATGVDVAASMVEIAAQRHPAAQFIQASATRLPFADGSFDAAVGNIVIQHIGEPERAALELRASARLGRSPRAVDVGCPGTLAVFRNDPRSGRRRECSSPTAIPTGPSFFQFADDVVFEALMQDAGFADVHIDAISFGVPLGSADEVVAGLVEGTVRTGALLRGADGARCSHPRVAGGAAGAVATRGVVCDPGVGQDRKRTQAVMRGYTSASRKEAARDSRQDESLAAE